MSKFTHKLRNFERALQRLSEAVENVDRMTVLEKEGLVQRFEYTLELAWKTLKEYLEEEGIVAKSPKNVIRHAYSLGIIDDADLWMDALLLRNLTSHTYNEELLERAVSFVRDFYPYLKKLFEKLKVEKES